MTGLEACAQEDRDHGEFTLFAKESSLNLPIERDPLARVCFQASFFDYDRYLGSTLTAAIQQMEAGTRSVMWSMDY